MLGALDVLLMAVLIGGLFGLQRMRTPRRGSRHVPSQGPGGMRHEEETPGRPGTRQGRTRPTPAQLAPLAAALSFIFPGLGHLLVRAPLRALIWFSGWVLVGLLSRGSHGVVLALMVVAGVDAFLVGRWTESDGTGPRSTDDGGDS